MAWPPGLFLVHELTGRATRSHSRRFELYRALAEMLEVKFADDVMEYFRQRAETLRVHTLPKQRGPDGVQTLLRHASRRPMDSQVREPARRSLSDPSVKGYQACDRRGSSDWQ
jgi:hypothetical protein